MRLLPRPCAWALVAALGLLTACSENPDWRTKDISGLMPELEFELTNHEGERVTAEDYRGHVVLLFFGFTSCPNYCPRTMARLERALADAGPAAEGARVLFVSVDPNRDTVEALDRFVSRFGERFVGLRGERETLEALNKRYRVTFGYGEGYPEGDYNVSHSNAVFIFDRQGEVRLLATQDDSAEAIAHDLRRLSQR